MLVLCTCVEYDNSIQVGSELNKVSKNKTRALWITTVLSHRSVKSVQLVLTHNTS